MRVVVGFYSYLKALPTLTFRGQWGAAFLCPGEDACWALHTLAVNMDTCLPGWEVMF